MDRLKAETGADPMPEPHPGLELPADESPAETADEQALDDELSADGAGVADEEDELA